MRPQLQQAGGSDLGLIEYDHIALCTAKDATGGLATGYSSANSNPFRQQVATGATCLSYQVAVTHDDQQRQLCCDGISVMVKCTFVRLTAEHCGAQVLHIGKGTLTA